MRLRHDFLKNDVAADSGEAEIEDDGGGFFLIESVQCVERILRFFGVEAGQCENRGKHPAQIVVVFHDQDFLAHMRTLAEFLPSRKLRHALRRCSPAGREAEAHPGVQRSVNRYNRA